MLQSSPRRSPGALVVLRHGESSWNAIGRFTGWVDVGLSAAGEAEAVKAGELLAEAGILPDVVHTSVLSRAFGTDMRPVHAIDPAFGVGGRYLDPEAAIASIATVRNQGQTRAA